MLNKVAEPKNKAKDLLTELKNHSPISKDELKKVIFFKVCTRWVAALSLGSFFPFGIWWAVRGYQWMDSLTSGTVLVLSIAGGLGLASAWMSKSTVGVDGQWGYAPLSEDELEEFVELASKDKDLSEVLDIWSGQCAQNNGTFRGRDWLFFKPRAEAYIKLKNPS